MFTFFTVTFASNHQNVTTLSFSPGENLSQFVKKVLKLFLAYHARMTSQNITPPATAVKVNSYF